MVSFVSIRRRRNSSARRLLCFATNQPIIATCPYASCNDRCIVHSASAGADPELVGGGGGCSCMLLLHPVLTCADAGPDFCTLCLRWLSLAATYSGCVSPPDVGTKTPLASVVVPPIATCAGGVFPSNHWRRYLTYTWATCTV